MFINFFNCFDISQTKFHAFEFVVISHSFQNLILFGGFECSNSSEFEDTKVKYSEKDMLNLI